VKIVKNIINTSKKGLITYGFTPPKKSFDEEKIAGLATKQINRIKSIDIDALVIYDIQDESDRNPSERPFPFLETLDPNYFCENYLNKLEIPKIIYTCVGKYKEDELKNKIIQNSNNKNLSVFVGSSSKNQKVNLSLSKAYEIYNNSKYKMPLGGVTIPERHIKNRNEHIKINDKNKVGCTFFISQAVYNLESAKNFLSDYYYYCIKNEIEMSPIIFTITPCGSLKTLEFMKWLGINIPIWLENELIFSKDILQKSIELEKNIFFELFDFANDKKIPIGCNIESVSIRKSEIESSIELVNDINKYIKK
jgi:hypothetical protein